LSAGTVSGYAAKSHVSVIAAASASAVPVGDATTGGKSTTPANIRSNAIVPSKRDARRSVQSLRSCSRR